MLVLNYNRYNDETNKNKDKYKWIIYEFDLIVHLEININMLRISSIWVSYVRSSDCSGMFVKLSGVSCACAHPQNGAFGNSAALGGNFFFEKDISLSIQTSLWIPTTLRYLPLFQVSGSVLAEIPYPTKFTEHSRPDGSPQPQQWVCFTN